MKKKIIFLILTILVFIPGVLVLFVAPLMTQFEIEESGGTITRTIVDVLFSGSILTFVAENGVLVDHSSIDPSDIGAKSYAASFIPTLIGCFSVIMGPIMIFATDEESIVGKNQKWSNMSARGIKRFHRVASIMTAFISGLGLLGLLVYIIPFRNNLLSTYPDLMPTFSFYYCIIVISISFFVGISRLIVMPKDIRNLVDFDKESDQEIELGPEQTADSEDLSELNKMIEQIEIDET